MGLGLALIEVHFHRFFYISTEFLPGVPLGENRLGQTFGAKTAISFLDHFKDKPAHIG